MHRLYLKRYLPLLSILSVFFTGMLLGQGANPYTGGDVTLRTQFDVDTFENGALYTSTNGNLTIDATGTITDLSNLADLESIGGELIVKNYGTDETNRDPLAAFSSLVTASGIRILAEGNDNPGITTIVSNTLSRINGDFEIEGNNLVGTVNLPTLEHIEGSWIIRDNNLITPVIAGSLDSINGDFRFNNNDNLSNLDDIDILTHIGGGLYIRNNQRLNTIDGLGFSARPIGKNVTNFVVDTFAVEDNLQLSTLDNTSLVVTAALLLNNNDLLNEVGTNANVFFGSTSSLVTPTAPLERIEITNNRLLERVSNAFRRNPTIVVDNFTIANNPDLENLGTQKLNVRKNFTFENNDKIFRLPSLSPTVNLTGDLKIVDNLVLGFENIRSETKLGNLLNVDGNVTITGNSAISRLQGIAGIQTVGQSFILDDNDAIANLDDLTDLTTIGTSLSIQDNATLSNCCQLPCQVTVNGQAFDGFNAAITIQNNTGGCADKRAVVTTCVNDSDKGCLQAAPVEFLTFTGTINGTAVDLDWSTASETDNDYFEIERAVGDGGRFAAIGRVSGAGDSQVQRDYSYTDYDFPGTLTYYRLRQVDFDGTYDYSNVVVIEGAATQTAALTLYPNPTSTGGVSVQLGEEWNAEQLVVEVFSASGQRVRRRVGMHGKQLELPTADLQGGVYIVRVTDGHRSASERLLVR